jgi:glycosyltransferase involved in cell wall biosynthesis
MRILLTVDPEIPVPPSHYGGIERIVAALIDHLREAGHQVGLIAHPDSKVQVDALWPWPAGSSGGVLNAARNLLCLQRAAAQFRPDVVHSFSRLAYLVMRLLRRQATVMSYQREPSVRSIQLALRLSGGTLRLTGCSRYIVSQGQSAGGAWAAIPNFVDLDKFPFVAAVAADAPLVFLSRIEEIKGAHWAIAIAKASGRRLKIAGNRYLDGDGARYFEQQIAPELGRNGIEYVGEVDDVAKAKLLGEAAAMVVPIQWNEPFGIVFAEALACGTPVISCPRGSLPEIVQTGEHGFLIRSIDEGIAAVAALPSVSRAACRERAERCYSRAKVGQQYEALYRSMLD